MSESAEVKAPMIFRALAGVIADIGAVDKNKLNEQQGYKYRSIDDVYNVLHPALAKNGVVIVPRILERERQEAYKTRNGATMYHVTCKIKFTFYAEDGSSVESIIIGESMDMGDKATNKAMAAAYKYACFQVFCIPTEEMQDPDAETPVMKDPPAVQEENKKPSGRKQERGNPKPPSNKEPAESPPAPDQKMDDRINQHMLNTIRAEQKRTGVTDQVILGRKKVHAKSIEELTIEEFKYIMSVFEKTPDRKEAANE